jgi:hypothetical protein
MMPIERDFFRITEKKRGLSNFDAEITLRDPILNPLSRGKLESPLRHDFTSLLRMGSRWLFTKPRSFL